MLAPSTLRSACVVAGRLRASSRSSSHLHAAYSDEFGPRGAYWTVAASRPVFSATTILCVRKGNLVVMAGDGQVSTGSVIAKDNARKVKRLGDHIVAGYAGSAADAIALFERLEAKLAQHPGQLLRAAVELGQDWRSDKALRHLNATMLVADKDISLLVSGGGDVMDMGDVMAIGSGGDFALACARGLIDMDLDAEAIARKAMNIAASLCVYTNHNLTLERIVIADTSSDSTTPSPVITPLNPDSSSP